VRLFEWIFGLGKEENQLYFLTSTNVGLEQSVLEAREAKENRSLQSVLLLSQEHKSLKAVWQFLHQSHLMYSAIGLVGRGKGIAGVHEDTDLLKASYGNGWRNFVQKRRQR